MREDTQGRRVARLVVTALGGFLVALGVAAAGGLTLLIAVGRGDRDWSGAGGTLAAFGFAVAWTIVAGSAAIWSSRSSRPRTIWLTGLPCVALGAVPVAVVARIFSS